ncbi:MAG: outer membrane beta-barrel protein [Sphingobium sp.]
MASVGFSQQAYAQANSVLVETAIPDSFNRDRNVSVTERARPDFDPLGFQSGSIIVRPQVQVGAGVTDNVFLQNAGGRTDGFSYVAPTITLQSDLPQDEIRASATAMLGRYFKYTRRNQNAYQLRLLGRKDIGSAFALTGEGQYARIYETPDTGAVDAVTSVLSTYKRGYLAARGRYRAGQFQGTLALDRTSFSFDDVRYSDGSVLNQEYRDQIMWRVTGEAQYALSPSLSFYGQVGLSKIDYSTLNFGRPNRDSEGYRIIGGVNFDLAGFMRGKIGVGYINRDYDSVIYKDADGLSAEALIEFFPTELTTVGIGVSRTLQDTAISGNSGAFFDNAFKLTVDHELLVNLLLGASGEYRRQIYSEPTRKANFYRLGGSATYFARRELAFKGLLQFQRRTNDASANGSFNEFRAELSVVFRR